MEYHTPSMFDANGVNMMSPIVQNGGVGNYPTPSFKYNGNDPYQTQVQNNYQYYSSMGQFASQQMQIYQNPYGYVGSYNPYNQQYMQQQSADIYRNAYTNGEIGYADYCSFNGGQPSFVNTNNQTTYYNKGSDDWYGSATEWYRKQQEYQRQQQQIQQEQQYAWDICRKISNNALGIENDQSEEQIKASIEYQQKWEAYRQKRAKEQYEADCLTAFILSMPNSTQKGYISPFKEQYVRSWNNYWHQRNDKYPEKYGVDEFLNQGILTQQIFDDMDDDTRRREKELNRLYDQNQFRQLLAQRHPDYDPVTGVSIKGARRLGIDDIEVQLPPNLSSTEYAQRRQRFFESIMKDNRMNLQTKY